MINTVEKVYGPDNVCSSYKVVYESNKICYVPHDEANKDYQAIQEWISAGNTVIDNPPE